MPKSKSKSKIIIHNMDTPVSYEEVVKILENESKDDFFPSVIKIKIDNEFYLEVDLLDYFERLNRQGWACSKVKKIGS